MPPGTNSPVAGSKGTWPEVTRKLPQSMAWEYGPMAAGALVVAMIFFMAMTS